MRCFPLWLINPIMRRRLCRIPDTGDFLKQVSRRSLWICTAHASSEPLLSCLATKRTVPLLTLLFQAGWSRAKVSEVSTSISKIYSNTLRQSYSALLLLSTLLPFPSLGEACVRHSRHIFNTINRKNSD